MATRQKKLAKAKPEPKLEAWALGDAFGLVEDGGWVDALKEEWSGLSPDVRAQWKELITLCRDAKPRGGQGWLEAENDVLFKCDPPLEYEEGDEDLVDSEGKPLFEPVPDPGTDAYQEALMRAAPDEFWLAQVRELIREGGGARFVGKLAKMFCLAVNSGIGSLNRNGPNKEILRALIWFAAATPDPKLIDALRQLATWSLEHNTAQAKTIAIVLTSTASEHSAAALRMIETSVKKPGRKARFARYASHVEQRIGLSAEACAERFIPTFGLDAAGVSKTVFGKDGVAELRIEGTKAGIRYFNASAKEIAACPPAIKRAHAAAFQELRTAAKGLGKMLVIQRDRLESFYVAQCSWDLPTWRERYLEHPVVGSLANRLIWQIGDSAVLCSEGRSQDARGKAVSFPVSARVSLWHPLQSKAKEVLAWRDRLEALGITQPFKQAHREVYLLTDAERGTANYSNRFAGHILRQPQFRALAAARGWKAPFLGDWDSGDRGIAKRDLPGRWRAEFWLYATGADEPEEHFQQRGMLHVSTDQVRFYRATETEPSPLEVVPPLLFSEVLRDVDLFVGVASVGNDPAWADGGPQERYRDYWQSYSFGDLSASARTRKEVLQRLVPKLRIAGRCSFGEKFLVVKGALRSYKIHLGSGNILMTPNDQYLCIVPEQKDELESPVLLPFEGDRTLSVIISKALLLADDVKIKDSSIVNQIKR